MRDATQEWLVSAQLEPTDQHDWIHTSILSVNACVRTAVQQYYVYKILAFCDEQSFSLMLHTGGAWFDFLEVEKINRWLMVAMMWEPRIEVEKNILQERSVLRLPHWLWSWHVICGKHVKKNMWNRCFNNTFWKQKTCEQMCSKMHRYNCEMLQQLRMWKQCNMYGC